MLEMGKGSLISTCQKIKKWKISPIQEIINAEGGNLDIPGFEIKELELCTEYSLLGESFSPLPSF